jgi:hypothetical protein
MVALFGRASWWLPDWAARLLRVSGQAELSALPAAAPVPVPARFP